MSNIGAYPVNPATDVGKFRLMAGDSEGTPIEVEPPAEPTEAEYAIWSDVQIQVLLAQALGSIAKAISMGYIQLAAQAASKSANIRTDDLSVNNTSRSGEFLKLAQYWETVADGQAADGFDIVYAPDSFSNRCCAEGASREICGCSSW
jgi:hypothetical protein